MAPSVAVAMITDYVRDPGAILVPDTRQRLRVFTDLVREWGRVTRIDEFLHHIAKAAVTLTGAPRAVVILTSLVEQFQVAAYAAPERRDSATPAGATGADALGDSRQFNGDLVEQVVLSGLPVFGREVSSSQPLHDPVKQRLHSPHTVTCVPLDSGHRQIGVLYVEHPAAPAAFDDTDMQLIEMIALHGAIAIENFNNLTRATTDPLTRVFTHRHFMMLVDHELRQSRRERRSNAMLLLDLDHFKRINDSLGHAIGNEYIVQFADFLRANIRSSDVLGRFGGDEFEILLPNSTQPGAETFARKIQAGLKQLRWKHGQAMTTSIGIAVFTDHADQADMLFQKADEALYAAKAQGRNCTVSAATKAEPSRPVDWSQDGAPPRAPDLPEPARPASSRVRSGSVESTHRPALPFPRVAVSQMFEDDKPHSPGELAAVTGLVPRELAKILKELATAGKIARQGRGKSVQYIRKIQA